MPLADRVSYARRQAEKRLTDTCAVLAKDATLNAYGETAAADPPAVDRSCFCLLFLRSGDEKEQGAGIVEVGQWGLLLPYDAVLDAPERVRITSAAGTVRGLFDVKATNAGATDALLLTVGLEKVG